MRMLFILGVIALLAAAPLAAADGNGSSPPPADTDNAPGNSGNTPASENAGGPSDEEDAVQAEASSLVGPDPGSSCRPMCAVGNGQAGGNGNGNSYGSAGGDG